MSVFRELLNAVHQSEKAIIKPLIEKILVLEKHKNIQESSKEDLNEK